MRLFLTTFLLLALHTAFAGCQLGDAPVDESYATEAVERFKKDGGKEWCGKDVNETNPEFATVEIKNSEADHCAPAGRFIVVRLASCPPYFIIFSVSWNKVGEHVGTLPADSMTKAVSSFRKGFLCE